MKILYGVQGTGNGHIARARVMANAFAKRNDVEVDYIFTGRDDNGYFDMEPFGNYRTFKGLSFVTSHGKISKWQTIKSVHLTLAYNTIKQLDLSQYDILLNDFEPITAWAARRQQLPSISISHQCAFNFPVPKKGESIIDRLLTRYFAPCDLQLGVHWYHFGHTIMPPFIEDKMDVEPSNQHVLVYLPFEELGDIAKLLASFTQFQFECFHPGVKMDRMEGNISWRRTSKSGFRDSIKHCSGVIANGGFELSSECLHLGKKILIKPLKGQYEQLSNMITLEKLGLCTSMIELDTQAVESWLNRVNPEPIYFPDNPDILIDWIVDGDWDEPEVICQKLWKQVKFPESVHRKLVELAV